MAEISIMEAPFFFSKFLFRKPASNNLKTRIPSKKSINLKMGLT